MFISTPDVFLSVGHFSRGIILFYIFCGDDDCDVSDRFVGLVKSIMIQSAFEVSKDVPAAMWFTNDELRKSHTCRFEFCFSLA